MELNKIMQQFGKGNKNLVFFHGGGVRPYSYMQLLHEFENDFTIYTFDMPGHGNAISTDRIDEAIQYLVSEVESLGLDEANFLGHSFGGFCAFETAKHFANVRNLIMIDPLMTQIKMSRLRLLYVFLYLKDYRSLRLHPKVKSFYKLAVKDNFENIKLQKLNAFKTYKLLMNASYCSKSVDLTKFPNTNVKVITGHDDSIIDAEEIQKSFGDNAIVVNGEHDWLMEDVGRTSKIVLDQMI